MISRYFACIAFHIGFQPVLSSLAVNVAFLRLILTAGSIQMHVFWLKLRAIDINNWRVLWIFLWAININVPLDLTNRRQVVANRKWMNPRSYLLPLK